MQLLAASAFMAGMTSVASATGILLPLYVYPTTETWQPVYNAISAHSNVPWTIVVNPNSGPGATEQPGNNDANYIAGTAKLNGYSNVNTVGYVRTNWAATPLETVKNDIAVWSSWSTYTQSDISVHGIFFDEAETNFAYLQEVISYTREVFNNKATTICNFGRKVSDEYYTICDIVVAFESCLNCSLGAQYQGQQTLDTNVPAAKASQAAVIVNQFNGVSSTNQAADTTLLNTYIKSIFDSGVGWYYFCSADYNDITTTPASVVQNVQSLALAM